MVSEKVLGQVPQTALLAHDQTEGHCLGFGATCPPSSCYLWSSWRVDGSVQTGPEGAVHWRRTRPPGASAVALASHRQGHQAREAEAHHVLLQPAAVREPGQLHRGAAHRQPGTGLRTPSSQAGARPPSSPKLSVWRELPWPLRASVSQTVEKWLLCQGWHLDCRAGQRRPAGPLLQPARPCLDSGLSCCLRTT